MKKSLDYFILFLSFLIILRYFSQEFFQVEKQKEKHSIVISQDPTGKEKVKSFWKAKTLAREFYKRHSFTTFYCGCEFEGASVHLEDCSYQPDHPGNQRSQRIEWEHVVPASVFGRKFDSWKNGHPQCRNSRGESYKGRECARAVSQRFREMEADLFNLVPVIGTVNQARLNYPLAELVGMPNELGSCSTVINKKRIYPREEVRGFVARIYLYMDSTYPGYGIIHKQNRTLIEKWNQKYPPSSHELSRNIYIQEVQGKPVNNKKAVPESKPAQF